MSNLDSPIPLMKYKDEQHRALVAVWYAGMLFEEILGKILTPFDITVEQFRILRILQAVSPRTIPVYNIRHYMHIRSDISRAVTQLDKRGLVQKSETEEDKRVVPVTLTPKGLQLMEDIMTEFTRGILAEPILTGQEPLQTISAMEKIIDVINDELKKHQPISQGGGQ